MARLAQGDAIVYIFLGQRRQRRTVGTDPRTLRFDEDAAGRQIDLHVSIGTFKEVEELRPPPRVRLRIGEARVFRVESAHQLLETPRVVGLEVVAPIGLVDVPNHSLSLLMKVQFYLGFGTV